MNRDHKYISHLFSLQIVYRSINLLPICAIFLLLLLSACSDSPSTEGQAGKKGKGGKKPAPVTVALCSRKDMPVEIQAIGSVKPFASVGIKSRVDGILKKVNFHEGDPVKAGDLLFLIDDRPFAARVSQASATLARDSASLDNARKQAQRYLPAAEKGYVSVEQSDEAQTNVATLTAAIQSDEASLENAHLDLEYCTIRSPISGYTGALLIDEGNLVKAAADEPMVTINQIAPIKVQFTLPEQTLPQLKQYLAAGTLEVRAILPYSSVDPLPGRVSFLDNMVNQTTGTIQLKAIFDNPKRVLWPGQFVNIRVLLTTRKNASVVPTQAIQSSQNGDYVYVVKKDQTVEERPVTVGFTVGDESVIDSGLDPGDTVVTDGQMRLKAGMAVKPVKTDATPPTGGASN